MKSAGDIDKRHGARACVTPTRPQVDGRCRPWAHISRCCRPALKANPTGRPTARFSCAPRAEWPDQDRRQKCSSGPRTTCSSAPPWMRYSHTADKDRCCSRFPTGRCRKRSGISARRCASCRGAPMTTAFVHDAPSQRIVFGVGSLARIETEITNLGIRRALVIATPGSGERPGREGASFARA